MYRMWNKSFEELDIESDKAFSFKTSRGLTDKLKIEELDALTSRFSSQEDFYDALFQLGNYVDGSDKNIIITHSKNKVIFLDNPIYNDKFIYSCAIELIQRKKEPGDISIRYDKTNYYPQTKPIILLRNSEAMLSFIDYIKELSLNPYAYKYFLNQSLLDDISESDKLYLGDCLYDDIYANGKLVKRGIKSLLRKYVELVHESDNRSDIESEIDYIEREINLCIRGDYRVLRRLVEWEDRCLEILKKQQTRTISLVKKRKYAVLESDILIHKQYRNGEVSAYALRKYYNNRVDICEEEAMEDDLAHQDYYENIFRYDESELSNLYSEGGIENVMNFMDVDEIYGNPNNYGSAVKLGIVKEKIDDKN